MMQKTKYARLLEAGDKFDDYGAVRTVKDVVFAGHDTWEIHLADKNEVIGFMTWDRVKLVHD